jgi:hypothetical protein
MITLTREEGQQVLFWLKFIDLPTTDILSKMMSDRLAQPDHIADERKKVCNRCGKVNPAEIHTCSPQQEEVVAWSNREIELINGMIEVQLNHAERCDRLPNRSMAEKQKGWDMERVALLQKIKAAPPQREWQGLTDAEIEAAFMVNTCCDDFAVFEPVSRAIEAKLKEKNK